MMSSVNPFTPVTPPPESLSFPKAQHPRPFPNPLKRKASSQEPPNGSILPPTSQPQQQPTPNTTPSVESKSQSPPATNATAAAATAAAPTAANLDPKYLAMVSRIAAYYQQRCQAVANYQQQRCQQWANMHRQRCQDMMQASMLVVAWYVRDRIQRRRRRERRKFRSGLKRRTSRPKIGRSEVVRRWVKQIPDVTDSPNSPVTDKLADRSEAEFSMDKEPPLDKDTKLFDMADNLIKSQYKNIEVPIMGVLNFGESDSESESDADEQFEMEYEDEAEGDDEYYEVEDDDLYDDDDDMEEDEDGVSEVVHPRTGSGAGTGNTNGRSSSS